MNDDEKVVRTIYITPRQDSLLRQMAFQENLTKSEIIRKGIDYMLSEYFQDNIDEIKVKIINPEDVGTLKNENS